MDGSSICSAIIAAPLGVTLYEAGPAVYLVAVHGVSLAA